MSDSRPEQLIHAEKLMYKGKVEEAFVMVINFEKRNELTQKDRLSALLLKGRIFFLTHQFKESIELGKLAYSMSQNLGLVPESIEALTLKSHMAYTGETDEAFDLILKGEKLLNSLSAESPNNITKLMFFLKIAKLVYNYYQGDFDSALDFAMDAISLGEKIKFDAMIGDILLLISKIYSVRGNIDAALEYAMKGLKLFEDLDFQTGIAASFYIFGILYFYKGDHNKSLEFCEKGLLREKLNDFDKSNILNLLGRIYQGKGELNNALKYTKQSIKLAEEAKNYLIFNLNIRNLGEIFRRKGEIDQAIKYFEQNLLYGEKMGIFFIIPTLVYLLLISLDKNLDDQAQQYLKRLESFSDQAENTLFKHGYPLAKALMLKMSTRMRDKVKAEELLEQIVEDVIIFPPFHILSIVSLCDLLLEELFIYNDAALLDEINPLIMHLLKIAEDQHLFLWLAEGKLLQAKLALIQMNIEEAKQFLTEAQQIAEERSLTSLAHEISNEHDILLEKIDEWEGLKKKDAPMAERIELASFDKVIKRLQGKEGAQPPDLVDEEPILLLIMDSSGATYFNHPFVENWDHSDLFSLFLSAFNTFSDEIFSKSIDRIRIGENTILINPVESFLTCYVIKGQSYPALHKLTRFSESIRENSEIWQALNKSLKTSEMLELDKPHALKTVIDEIF